MEARFVRSDHDRYLTRVRRDDGVTLEIRGFSRARGLPHDLAHFVVESELDLPFGFWGCVAAGAQFGAVFAGRRPPHGRERSKAVLKQAGQRLTEAEVLVGVLTHAAGTDSERYWPTVRAKLDRGWTILSPLDEQAVEEACRLLRQTAVRWSRLPVGDELPLCWRVQSRFKMSRPRSR